MMALEIFTASIGFTFPSQKSSETTTLKVFETHKSHHQRECSPQYKQEYKQAAGGWGERKDTLLIDTHYISIQRRFDNLGREVKVNQLH